MDDPNYHFLLYKPMDIKIFPTNVLSLNIFYMPKTIPENYNYYSNLYDFKIFFFILFISHTECQKSATLIWSKINFNFTELHEIEKGYSLQNLNVEQFVCEGN